MIKLLQLENFRLARSVDIELHPGVNVIRGENDSGKSCLLKGIRWVWLGKPSGDRIISFGEKDCGVGIQTGDDRKILRLRHKSTTVYEVDGVQLKAFGQTIPDEVTEALGLSPYCYAGQFDPPFAVADTGGEFARMLNSLADLSLIDTAHANAASFLKEAERKAELLQQQKQQTEEDLSLVRDFGKEEKKLEEITGLLDEITGTRDRIIRLRELSSLLDEALQEQAESSMVEVRLSLCLQLISVTREREEAQKTLLEFREAVESLLYSRGKIGEDKEEIAEMETRLASVKTVQCSKCGSTIPAGGKR